MDKLSDTKRWQRSVFILLSSQTIAAFGTALTQFAITWYLTLETESGVIMALSIVFGMLPQAVISVLGGVLADRIDKRRLIVIAQGLIVLATVGLALAMSAGYGEHWLIFLVLAIRSVGAGLRTPPVSALVPQLVPSFHLLRVNGTYQAAQSVVSILSPVAAAAALASTSITTVLAIDIAVSICGIILVLITPLPDRQVAGERAKTKWQTDLIEGIKYTKGHCFVRWVFTMAVVVILLGAAPAYLVPLRIARAFGGEVWMLGGSQISVSLGMIAVGSLAAIMGQRLKLTVLVVAAPAMFGVASIILGITQNILVLFCAMFLAGAALTIATGMSGTLLQERVERSYLGRVFGLFGLVLFAMPLGLVIFGPLADLVPVEILFICSGVAIFIVSLAVLLSPFGRAAIREGMASRELRTVTPVIYERNIDENYTG